MKITKKAVSTKEMLEHMKDAIYFLSWAGVEYKPHGLLMHKEILKAIRAYKPKEKAK